MLALAALAAGVTIGCGADTSDVPGAAFVPVDDGLPVIEIEMVEMAFDPDAIDVTSGDTVRLRFHNGGQAIHDAVIGDLAFQLAQDAAVAAGETQPADADQVLIVAPGDTADLVYTAGPAGALIIGCHQPGHWNAGMRADLNIG
jgi:uncharacterized cupredoxin-like copper-binding protein